MSKEQNSLGSQLAQVNAEIERLKKERDEAVEVMRTLVKNVEQSELKGSSALVLYFPTEQDREEVIQAFKDAKPNWRSVKI